MSDTNVSMEGAPASETAPANPAIANAAQALAVKEMGETVAGLKKSVKTLWIVVIVTVVLAIGSLVMNFVPGVRFGLMGGGRPDFQNGQFNRGNGTWQAPSGGIGGGTNR